MDFLLRLKPWHLFILLMISNVFSWFSPFAGIGNLLFFVFYTGWAHAVGLKMNALLPEAIRPATRFFKIHYWLLVGFTLFTLNILRYIQSPAHSEDYNLFVS
jgi:hypothetical protein